MRPPTRQERIRAQAIDDGLADLVSDADAGNVRGGNPRILARILGIFNGTYATFSPAPTGGTFTVSVTVSGNTDTTTAIAWNASAATVQAAIEALADVGVGGVEVGGPDGGPYAIVLSPELGPDASYTIDTSGLTGGTITYTVTDFAPAGVPLYAWELAAAGPDGETHRNPTTGRPDAPDFEFTPAWEITGNLHVPLDGSAIVDLFPSDGGGYYWFQLPHGIVPAIILAGYSLSIDADGGTYTLTVTVAGHTAQTTGAIAWNASASTVEAAIAALSHVGAGNVQVTGDYLAGYTITFAAALGDVQVTADSSGLTGGSTSTAIITSGGPAYAWHEAYTAEGGSIVEIPPPAGRGGSIAVNPAYWTGDRTLAGGTACWIERGYGAPPDVVVTITQHGDGMSLHTVQAVYLTDATGGTWTLTCVYVDQSGVPTWNVTAPLQWDADAAAVQSAIQLLPNFGMATVTGSGTFAAPFVVTLNDTYRDQPILVGDPFQLVGVQEWFVVTVQDIDAATGIVTYIALASLADIPGRVAVTVTGDVTNGSAIVTGISPDTSALSPGMPVYASGSDGLPDGTVLQTVDSSTQITLNLPWSLPSATGVTLLCYTDTPGSGPVELVGLVSGSLTGEGLLPDFAYNYAIDSIPMGAFVTLTRDPFSDEFFIVTDEYFPITATLTWGTNTAQRLTWVNDTLRLNVPAASLTLSGIITTGTQTITGAKTIAGQNSFPPLTLVANTSIGDSGGCYIQSALNVFPSGFAGVGNYWLAPPLYYGACTQSGLTDAHGNAVWVFTIGTGNSDDAAYSVVVGGATWIGDTFVDSVGNVFKGGLHVDQPTYVSQGVDALVQVVVGGSFTPPSTLTFTTQTLHFKHGVLIAVTSP